MEKYYGVKSVTIPAMRETDEYSVWINTDIHEVETDNGTEFEFNQTRYTKDEYIGIIDEKNDTLEAQLTDTQLALCEVYEMII